MYVSNATLNVKSLLIILSDLLGQRAGFRVDALTKCDVEHVPYPLFSSAI